MGKILPILLALLGLGAGVGGGIALRPGPAEMVVLNPCGDSDVGHEPTEETDTGDVDYVKLNNQFIVPVVREGNVSALVVLALSLEVRTGETESIYEREPKIRDAFLQVLFNHANAGGFDGEFTSGLNMSLLRDALRETAIRTLGNAVTDVLIVDVVRQDT